MTYEEDRFFLGSSTAKMWTVPWSLAAHKRDESELKFKLFNQNPFITFQHNIMDSTVIVLSVLYSVSVSYIHVKSVLELVNPVLG